MTQFAFGLPKRTVRGALALALVGAVIYLAITTGEVPAALGTLAGAAVTFYFHRSEDERRIS